jgi:tRNA(Ile)-lysidine synthase
MNLVQKVAKTIKKYSMLYGGETVLVGLSGGPDSVCLLTVLKKLNMALKLHALYIDHGLRPEETPKEIEFCKDLCQRMDIPFRTKSVDVKSYAEAYNMNKQEAARQLRYEMLNATALEIKANAIALGHNLDDQVETFLMRILRGSGLRGLLAIPPVRGKIIRPLIETERKDIEAFLDQEGIDFIIDSSNLKQEYLRNKLRFSVIPLLKELNPSLMETLSNTLEIFREEERYFEIAVTKAMMKLISRKTENTIELFLTPLEVMEKVILRRVLRRAIDETKGLRGISFINIEDIIKLITTGKPGDRLYLPKGIRVIKKYSTLLLTSEPPAKLNTYTLEPEGEAIIKEAGIMIKAFLKEKPCECDGKTKAVFDADKITFPLTIRARKPGDFFYPFGFGKRKKLQDFFVDEKVPRDERDIVPIVTSGDDIIWLAGYRADERFRHSEGTKRFLVLEMKIINT